MVSRFREVGILDAQNHFKPTNTFQCLHFSSNLDGMFKGLLRAEAIELLEAQISTKEQSQLLGTTYTLGTGLVVP